MSDDRRAKETCGIYAQGGLPIRWMKGCRTVSPAQSQSTSVLRFRGHREFILMRKTMAETMEAAEAKQQLQDLKQRMLALKEHL